MKRRDGAPAGPAGRRQFVTSQAFLTLLDPVDEPARPEEGRGSSWAGQQKKKNQFDSSGYRASGHTRARQTAERLI